MAAYHAIGKVPAFRFAVLAEPDVVACVDALFARHPLISFETDVGGSVVWWFTRTPRQRLSLDGLYGLLTDLDHFVDVTTAACLKHGVANNVGTFRAGTIGTESGAPVSSGLFRK